MTRISASSHEAKDLELGTTYYSASSTFQTLVGAGSAAAAKRFVVEGYGGHQADDVVDGPDRALAADDDMTRLELPCTHAYVGFGPWDPEQVAWRTIWQSGLLQTSLYLDVAAYRGPDILRYVLNQAGAIRSEIQELIGSAAPYHAEGVAALTDIIIPPPESYWHGYGIARIDINWES